MNLQLRIIEHEIEVVCELEVQNHSYSFALAHTLELYNIRNNNLVIEPAAIEACELPFRPAMKKYTFTNLKEGTLYFSYRGPLDGYFLFMQESICHFSMYNGWYPIGFDVIEEYDITLFCDASYELINGTYDQESQCWQYSTKTQEIIDCNIMLINTHKSKRLSNDLVTIYDVENRYEAYIEPFFEHYTSVCHYYEALYGHNPFTHTNIIFLPEKYNLGAYKRDQLIVFTELDRSIEEEQHHLAHELAHAYANGADTSSWEDWLNETHAEWSALLYEEAYNPDLFHQLINTRKKAYETPYVLNPKKKKRPDDVHEAGTLIYYELYELYGRACIETLLQVFDQLEVKNTVSFFEMLCKQHHTNWVKHIQAYII